MATHYELYINFEELFRLVKSLNKREKAIFIFKAGARKNGKKASNFILFSLLDAAKDFDKHELEQVARDKGVYTSAKQFIKLKRYLYLLVLEAVQDAHGSIVGDVSNLIVQAKLLSFKGFYSLLPPMLNAAMRLARDTEAFEDQLAIIRLLRRHHRHVHGKAKASQLEAELNLIESEVKAKIVDLWEWEELDKLRSDARSAILTIRQEAVHQMKARLVLRKNVEPKSLKAALCRLLIHQAVQDGGNLASPKRVSILQEILDLIRASTPLLQDSEVAHEFMYASFNLAMLGIKLQLEDAVNKGRDSLDFLKEVNPQMDSLIQGRVVFLELFEARMSHSFPHCQTATRKATDLFRHSYEISSRSRYLIALEGACINLAHNRAKMAMRLLNFQRNEDVDPDYLDQHCAIWMAWLVSCLEDGDYGLLAREASYALQWLGKLEDAANVALAFAKMMRAVARKPEMAQEIFQEQGGDLIQMLRQPSCHMIHNIFPFEIYIQSRMASEGFGFRLFQHYP